MLASSKVGVKHCLSLGLNKNLLKSQQELNWLNSGHVQLLISGKKVMETREWK